MKTEPDTLPIEHSLVLFTSKDGAVSIQTTLEKETV